MKSNKEKSNQFKIIRSCLEFFYGLSWVGAVLTIVGVSFVPKMPLAEKLMYAGGTK